MGLSPVGGEKFSHFSPGIRWACIVDDNLSVYKPQILGLYAPEGRSSKNIYVEWHMSAGVIMCEALWALNCESAI